MADLEKVIRGLECYRMKAHGEIECGNRECEFNCRYSDESELYCAYNHLLFEAIELLKAQEPIEPIEFYDDTKCVEDYNRTLAWKCGKCGHYIGGADNFCANCGQAVKWE